MLFWTGAGPIGCDYSAICIDDFWERLWVTAANTYEVFCAPPFRGFPRLSDIVLGVGRKVKRILSHCCEPTIGKMRMLPMACDTLLSTFSFGWRCNLLDQNVRQDSFSSTKRRGARFASRPFPIRYD